MKVKLHAIFLNIHNKLLEIAKDTEEWPYETGDAYMAGFRLWKSKISIL